MVLGEVRGRVAGAAPRFIAGGRIIERRTSRSAITAATELLPHFYSAGLGWTKYEKVGSVYREQKLYFFSKVGYKGSAR